MNLCNYHSHCDFCDGHAPAEEFVKAAIEAGFHSYGISSHSPLPFETEWNLNKNKVTDYINEINRLKEKYSSQIKVYLGMEIDYMDETWNPSNEYFQSLPLDYQIGSVHFVKNKEADRFMDMDGGYEEFKISLNSVYNNDLKQLVFDYFDSSMKMIELGGFDFIAHPDKISMNGSKHDPELLNKEWYKNKWMEYFSLISEKNLIIEVNTKAFSRFGLMFPHIDTFKTINELKIPILVNSDAHYPQYVNENRETAFKLLQEAGFKTTMQFENGKWIEVPI